MLLQAESNDHSVSYFVFLKSENNCTWVVFIGGEYIFFFNPEAKQLFSQGEFLIFEDEKLRAEKYLISSLQSQKTYQKNLENYNIFNVWSIPFSALKRND